MKTENWNGHNIRFVEVKGENLFEPVGETNTDNARFSNLQTLLNTLDILIDEVTFVLPCENRYEYSMQRAGQEVRHWIKDKRQQFAYNLGEGEQNG